MPAYELIERMIKCAKPQPEVEVIEIVAARHGDYDNRDMAFEADVRLKDGRTAIVKGRYSPTWDEVIQSKIFIT